MQTWEYCKLTMSGDEVWFFTSNNAGALAFKNQGTIRVEGIFELELPRDFKGNRGWPVLSKLLADGWEPFAVRGDFSIHLKRLAG
ncbi:MAG: hypothetical protein HW403_637 [Dehalococcoidia bacterium]|nr:hypothetical protein [Dehalococcoidia bacterium]